MAKEKINTSKKASIPIGWKQMPFGEVFEFIQSLALTREQLTDQEGKENIYNIHYGDIHATYNSNVLDFEKEKRIPIIKGKIEIKQAMLLKDGDLAIADASEDYEGVASSIEIKNLKNKKAVGGLHTFIARDFKDLTNPGFRTYILKNPKVSIELKKLATGSKVYGVSKTNLASLDILLPPNEEQIKMAKIFATCDKIIETLEDLLDRKTKYKKGLMQRLLTGKKRFEEFKGQKWKKLKLGEICSAILDGTHQTPSYTLTGIPFYSVENVTRKDFTNTKFISLDDHLEMSKRCKLMKNDILVTRIGSIGDTVFIDWDVNASIYVSLALIRVNDNLCDPYFIYQYTKSNFFRNELLKRSLLWAAPQKINLGEIQDIDIYIPVNKSEQTKIATLLSSSDREIQILKNQVSYYRKQKKGLMQTLLTGKKRVKL